jgi:hypothetical protein
MNHESARVRKSKRKIKCILGSAVGATKLRSRFNLGTAHTDRQVLIDQSNGGSRGGI